MNNICLIQMKLIWLIHNKKLFPQGALFLFLQYKVNNIWQGQVSQTGCGQTGRMFLLLQWPLAAQPVERTDPACERWEVPRSLINSRDSLFPHFLLRPNGHQKEKTDIYEKRKSARIYGKGPFFLRVCETQQSRGIVQSHIWDRTGSC